MTVRIEILSTSAGEGSNSRACAEYVSKIYKEKFGFEAGVNDLRSFTPVWVDGRKIEDYPPEYKLLQDKIFNADGIIIAAPVHCYTVAQPTKTITEIILTPIKRLPVGFIHSSASMAGYLAPRDIISSVLFDCESIVFHKNVLITYKDIENGMLMGDAIERTDRFAADFFKFVSCLQNYRRAN